MIRILLFSGFLTSILASEASKISLYRRQNTCNGLLVVAGYHCIQQAEFPDLLCSGTDGGCGNACYDSNQYVCADQANSITCPKTDPALCGTSCYNDANYHCVCGNLMGGPRTGPYPSNCPLSTPSKIPQAPPLPPPPAPVIVTITHSVTATSTLAPDASIVTQLSTITEPPVTTTLNVTITATATATTTITTSPPPIQGYDTIDLYCLPQAVIGNYKMSYANYGYLQVTDPSTGNVLGYAGMVDLQMRYLTDSIDAFAYYADDMSLSVYGHDYGIGIGPSVTVSEGSAANILYFGAVGCNLTWNYNQSAGLSYTGYNIGADMLPSPNSGQYMYLYLGAVPAGVIPVVLQFVPASLLPSSSSDKRNESFGVARQLWTSGWV